MDLRAGRLPQPHHQQSSASASSSSSAASNPFNGTEAIRTNEPNKFITFKDVYDYLSLDILGGFGSNGSASDQDLLFPFALNNYSLDTSTGSLATGVSGSGGAALAVNQSTTFFQNPNFTSAWNSSTLWLTTNGSLFAAAAATTATSGAGGGLISNGNGANQGAGEGEEELGDIIVTAATTIILGLMILITVIGESPSASNGTRLTTVLSLSLCSPGNVFVIAAIILERNLQNVANYLVASLAVADLFVACLVMPLGALYEVRGPGYLSCLD